MERDRRPAAARRLPGLSGTGRRASEDPQRRRAADLRPARRGVGAGSALPAEPRRRPALAGLPDRGPARRRSAAGSAPRLSGQGRTGADPGADAGCGAGGRVGGGAALRHRSVATSPCGGPAGAGLRRRPHPGRHRGGAGPVVRRHPHAGPQPAAKDRHRLPGEADAHAAQPRPLLARDASGGADRPAGPPAAVRRSAAGRRLGRRPDPRRCGGAADGVPARPVPLHRRAGGRGGVPRREALQRLHPPAGLRRRSSVG